MFEEKKAALQRLITEAADYCESTWLALWKERLVAVWTNEVLHFSNIVTSRLEGCHAKLKSYLQNSRHDLWTFFHRAQDLWKAENTEWEAKVSPN